MLQWPVEAVSESVTKDPRRLADLLSKRFATLATILHALQEGQSNLATVRAGDTTPSVAGVGVLLSANTGATSITQFDDGSPGQRIVFVFGDANTTLVHGANLVLASGSNFTGASGNTRAFVTTNGTVFRQVPLG